MKIYIALAAFPFLAFAPPSMAQNRVDLGAQALSNIRGSMGVNMVAGNNNQQGNLAAIAISGPAVIQFGQLNQSTTNLNGSQGRCEQVPDMRSCLSSGAMEQGSS